MPCKGFICPMERKKVGWDHFETCNVKGGYPAFDPIMARYWVRKQEEYDARKEEEQRSGHAPSATRLLGCPRASVIEATMDWWVDPSGSAMMIRGSMMHDKWDDETDPEVWWTERRDADKLTVTGVIGGVKVKAIMDALKKDMSEIVDHKFPNDFSVRWRKTVPRGDYQVQLNICRLLLAQQEWAVKLGYNEDRVRLTVWDHAIGHGDPPRGQECKHMTEAQILAHYPGSTEKNRSKYKVAHNMEMLEWAEKGMEGLTEGEDKKSVAASLPLAGETQMNGDKCTKYCGVSKECDALLRQYGHPTVEFDS